MRQHPAVESIRIALLALALAGVLIALGATLDPARSCWDAASAGQATGAEQGCRMVSSAAGFAVR